MAELTIQETLGEMGRKLDLVITSIRESLQEEHMGT